MDLCLIIKWPLFLMATYFKNMTDEELVNLPNDYERDSGDIMTSWY